MKSTRLNPRHFAVPDLNPGDYFVDYDGFLVPCTLYADLNLSTSLLAYSNYQDDPVFKGREVVLPERFAALGVRPPLALVKESISTSVLLRILDLIEAGGSPVPNWVRGFLLENNNEEPENEEPETL